MAASEVRTPFGVIHPNRSTADRRPRNLDGSPRKHIHKRPPALKGTGRGRCVSCGAEFGDEDEQMRYDG